jgi:D-methionine transport system ATP-binding protein
LLLQLNSVGYTPPNFSQPILADISLAIAQGERVTLTGATGAGKSTLFRLLNRLSDATVGKIYLEGKDYQTIHPVELRRQVVLVSQEPKLLGMTVRAALAYPLQLRGIATEEIKQRIINIAERLAIPSELFDRVEIQLSAGEKQLIAIARALITQPKILLLDEPIAHLDFTTAERLLATISTIANSDRLTTIAINHQVELGVQFSDRLLYLHAGKLTLDRASKDIDWQELQLQMREIERQAIAEWG